MIDDTAVVTAYRARAETHWAEAAERSRAIARVSSARLVGFVIALLAAAKAIADARNRWPFAALSLIGIATFVWLVRRTRRLRAQHRHASDIAHINEQAAYRAQRDWTHIAAHEWGTVADVDGTLADLDVFGPQSLVQLLPPVSPGLGRVCIRRWLSRNATEQEILERQDAIHELSPDPSFRDELTLHGRRAYLSADAIARFADWSTADAEPRPRWLDVASFAGPSVTLLLIVLQATGVVAAPLWELSIAIVLGSSMLARSRTRALLRPATEMTAIASTYAAMVGLIADRQFTSSKLAALRDHLSPAGAESAVAGFKRLSAVAEWAETSASPMLHVLLQALLMYEWHVARYLTAWRRQFGTAVPEWFDVIAEIEALGGFAGLAHANPRWTFPHVGRLEPVRVEAARLGHPLLPAPSRVDNDIVVGPAGTVQLISGSNMSGKSTLLRAVGLNVVLARAGAPVCATSMRCPIVDLHTSIRIGDSLQLGVSYFMAEIRRLKDIIDAAEIATRGGGPPVLYLVDEMLRGTNSEERAVASRVVVRRLLDAKAVGMITSHDLAMFDDPRLAGHVEHHHFRELFDGPHGNERMWFDYRLQPGPTTAGNALKLLALVGITPSAR